jgi:CheY-like chemotaxis protein
MARENMARILIIEDSAQMRALIRDILEADGHSVLEAKEGLKGLQMAATQPPACILLDLILPDMDGLTVLRLLGQQGSQIPVIVISAHSRDVIRAQCLSNGAAAFIGKPPIESELRHTVATVLGSGNKSS